MVAGGWRPGYEEQPLTQELKLMTAYIHVNLPTVWIIHKDGAYWLVHAIQDGWRKRRPFNGDPSRLERVESWRVIGLGIPK